MSFAEFKTILTKIKKYTKYLYFHVMGEPLMHPQINEFINEASKDFYVNITTNGYLIKKISHNKNIRQINISLHSFNPKYNYSLNQYLENICTQADILCKNTIINFRLWTSTPYKDKIINYLNRYYKTDIILSKGFKIKENVFIEEDTEFIWPNLQNDFLIKNAGCKALKDHIGILVSGIVVPCCLDSEGIIALGNIFTEDLEQILNNPLAQEIKQGFNNNQRIHKLCQKCNFRINNK